MMANCLQSTFLAVQGVGEEVGKLYIVEVPYLSRSSNALSFAAADLSRSISTTV
jgi:hypothetical protein